MATSIFSFSQLFPQTSGPGEATTPRDIGLVFETAAMKLLA